MEHMHRHRFEAAGICDLSLMLVFTSREKGRKLSTLHDLFLLGMKLVNIEVVKWGLGKEFKMKDLGEAKFLLGIEIRRRDNGDVFLVQEKYARGVLSRFNM